jgi:hypothetical protein
VPALLLGLLVKELGELRECLRVVVRADRDVLVRGGELPPYLLVEGGDQPFRWGQCFLLRSRIAGA